MKNAHRSRISESWRAGIMACLTTLLALPAQAGFTIPDDPLTLSTRVAPNILFILDDSGSMSWEFMPDQNLIPTTTTPDVSMQAYTRNTLSYNPAVTYLPWTKADGTRMTGGTSYNAVYGSFNLVGGTLIDLSNPSSCGYFSQNDSATTDENSNYTQRCGGVQTYYVPQDPTQTSGTYLGDGTNYYRYQILTNGTIVRSRWLAYNATNTPTTSHSGTLGASLSGTNALGAYSTTWSLNIPSGASNLVFSSSGGSVTPSTNRGADLYERYNNGTVTTTSYDNRSTANGNTESITIANPSAGNYYVRLYAQTAYVGPVTVSYSYTDYSGTAALGCATTTSGSDWRECTQLSFGPTGRSIADELTNYATWFSYHRTRVKSAKAGASEAFKSFGNKVRLGFRTIWNRNNLDIPVADGNDGRFVDNSTIVPATTARTNWYNRLFGVIAYNGTPLHGALDSAGRYFSDTSATGPYGPESGSNQYACRQNFTILTTDGYWNSTNNYPGASFSNGVWTGGVGEQDNVAGTTITGPNNQSYTYSPISPYKSADSGTLADVAMKYWKTDLRPDLNNVVPTSSSDPAFWQHMTTFGISIGAAGTSGYTSVGSVPSNYLFNNPNDAEDSDRVDDLLHAALNGHGEFVAATNPQVFSQGLRSALGAIAQRTSSYSNVAANSVSLGTGTQVFNATFVSSLWTGNLTAAAVNDSGVSSTLTWTASIPTWNTRNIFTSNGTSGAIFPTSSQITSLTRTGGPIDYPVTGADNANYIKGEQRLEGPSIPQLRVRHSLLGDIIGSSPAYVKDTNTLYVGANDGMLHAFDAANGQELFSYIPNIVNWANLSTLSRGDYSHRFLVDGPVTVSSRLLTPGRNILVGTLGRGGKGLYALDVSTPAAPSASMFKWESAETTGGNMGLVLSKPLLAKTYDGSTSVVFGNGVNSSHDRAVLVVLNADTGAVIREIDTGQGSATTPNGLSAISGIYGKDGKSLAYVYAGDMLGNVWKFDLTSATPASWTATRLFTTPTTATTPAHYQPITGGIAVATDPTTLKRWVLFGTGSFLTASDATDTTTQAMYGIIDDGSGSPVALTDLTQRSMSVTSGVTVSGYPVRAFQSYAPLPAGSKGWYLNLPESGERIVQDAQVVSNFLMTASMIPVGTGCGADGSGYINALNAFTGTSGLGSFFDLDGNGQTDDTAVTGGLPVGSVNLGNGMPTLPNNLRGRFVSGGSGGSSLAGSSGGTATLKPIWKRLGWVELEGN